MNTLRLNARFRGLISLAVAVCVLGIAACGLAGVTINQLPDAAAWPGTPTISTTGNLNLTTDFNVAVTIPPTSCGGTGGCSGAANHTFVATSSFLLDKLIIRLGGAPTTGEIYLYPEPVGGTDADGFVNVSFSTSLLNGGAGLPFTFNGNPDRRLVEFDLTGSDEITLSPGTKYSLDIRNTGSGSIYWDRISNAAHLNDYLAGNIYQTYDHTQPGERYDVGGGRRDGTLALYAPAPAGVPGDYNGNGTVDAADYTLWRNGGPLQNEVDTAGTVNTADYDAWRARFGNPLNPGAGSAVPEPAAWLLTLMLLAWTGTRRQDA